MGHEKKDSSQFVGGVRVNSLRYVLATHVKTCRICAKHTVTRTTSYPHARELQSFAIQEQIHTTFVSVAFERAEAEKRWNRNNLKVCFVLVENELKACCVEQKKRLNNCKNNMRDTIKEHHNALEERLTECLLRCQSHEPEREQLATVCLRLQNNKRRFSFSTLRWKTLARKCNC